MPRRRATQRTEPAPRPPDWRSYDSVAEEYERVRADFHAMPARDLVALAAPPVGGSVLDVGTGPGIAAAAALDAVGEEGRVVGVDRSLAMLHRARARGIANVVGAAALDLPFRNGSFDVVLASFVIFFFTKYETALHDMHRVLRPEGRLAVTTWGENEDEFRRAWRGVAESFVGKDLLRDAQRRGAPWEERFSRRDPLVEALRGAGLRSVRVEQRQYRGTWSHADYLAGRETTSAGRFLRDMLGDASWERFRDRVAEEFRSRFADPLGDTHEVLLAVGTKAP